MPRLSANVFVASSEGTPLTPAAPVPLADLVAGLSRALDLTEGEPLGHSIRACWIGMRIGRVMGLTDEHLHELYYALLLKDVGCSANAAQVSSWFGVDDHQAKADLKRVDWAKFREAALYAMAHAAPGEPFLKRVQTMVGLARRGISSGRELVELRCTRGADIVRSLGWRGLVPDAVLNLDEHWDGHGYPSGVKGPAIPLLSRILLLAQTAEIAWRRDGAQACLDLVAARRGTWFDPALVDVLTHLAHDRRFFLELGTIRGPADLARDAEDQALWPDDQEADILQVAEVFGQIVDAKSPWTASHSLRCAQYGAALARGLGLDADAQRAVELAGYFHDLGKLGVSNLFLDKPGPLTPPERHAVSRHAELTGVILDPMPALAEVAEAARSHHERLDGSGYYRGLEGSAVPWAAQIIAVADVYDALTADRPYRPGLPPGEALRILAEERDQHKLAGPVVEAAAHLSDAAATNPVGAIRGGHPGPRPSGSS